MHRSAVVEFQEVLQAIEDAVVGLLEDVKFLRAEEMREIKTRLPRISSKREIFRWIPRPDLALMAQ